jgi:hypothetical protein
MIRFAISLRVLIFALGMLNASLLCNSTLRAQFGFAPSAYMPNGYGSEWGNYYSSAVAQVPQYGYPSSIAQPTTYVRQGWQLGAYIQNTYNGVLIQQVVPGGLAERTGLKAGDVVVSVGGAQVGYVNGRSVDLVYEIGRRADAYGVARLVVLDAFSRQLKTYDMNISQQATTSPVISGRVFLEGGLPVGNGTLKVELQNVTRPYLQASGGHEYKLVSGSGPFPFTIFFDPRYVVAQDRYRLIATLYNPYQQVAAYTTFDLPESWMGAARTYDLRLQSAQIYSSSMTPSYGNYYPNQNAILEAFQQFLARSPSASESQVWSQQLASGMTSLAEMKAQLLASPAFYDRAGNNPDLFVQQMIVAVTRLPAPPEQVQAWRSRLDTYGGNRLMVTREFMRGYSLSN